MKTKNSRFISIIFNVMVLMVSTFLCMSTYAVGWTDLGSGVWAYINADGDYETETIKSSGEDKYYLDDQGIMVRDYLLEDYNENTYYFDEEGKMVKNTWVAVDPYETSDPLDYGPTVYLFYFGPNGKAFRASSGAKRKIIDGKKYMFDEQGRMLSGWINSSGEMFGSQDASEDPFLDDYIYYAGDETDGVLHEGWLEYTDGSLESDHEYYKKETMWFYFNPSSNKKQRYDGSNGNSYGQYYQKKINGQTYAFDENGVMLVGWEASPATRYFAEDNKIEGQLLRKQWFYAVPSQVMGLGVKNSSNDTYIGYDYDNETERWFYSGNNGDITKNIMKRINGKEYVFDGYGIMKSGLVIVGRLNKKFIATIDIEGTDGKNFLVDRQYFDRDRQEFIPNAAIPDTFDPEIHKILYFVNEDESNNFGQRKDGLSVLAFSDNDYKYISDKKGELEGYKKKQARHYFQYGLMLEPDQSIGMGIVLDSYASPSTAVDATKQVRSHTQFRKVSFKDGNIGDVPVKYNGNEYHVYYDKTKYGMSDVSHWEPVYRVVDGTSKMITKGNVVKKDKNNNYWIIDHQGYFVKIVSVPAKYNKSDNTWYFKSEAINARNKAVTMWIPFGQPDQYLSTVALGEPGTSDKYDYDVLPDESYALNFAYIYE